MKLLLAALFLTGCAGVGNIFKTNGSQSLNMETTYKRDMIIRVNNVTREGMITMPLLKSNSIHITTSGDLDLFVLDNCSGEWTSPQAWNVTTQTSGGLFNWFQQTVTKKRERQFDFVPPAGTSGSCPLTMASYSVDGQDSWGFIDWQTPEFKLLGTIVCNSEAKAFEGVEACQTRTGKRTELHFKNEVVLSPDKGCEIGATKGKDFNFPMPHGWCVYRIKDKKTGLVGKLDLLGYDGILVRANAVGNDQMKRRMVK